MDLYGSFYKSPIVNTCPFFPRPHSLQRTGKNFSDEFPAAGLLLSLTCSTQQQSLKALFQALEGLGTRKLKKKNKKTIILNQVYCAVPHISPLKGSYIGTPYVPFKGIPLDIPQIPSAKFHGHRLWHTWVEHSRHHAIRPWGGDLGFRV